MNEKDLLKAKEEKTATLVNFILEYAIKNSMSLEEIDNCVSKVAEVYYTDGLIKK